MKVWIVFVKVYSANGLIARYIDSQWCQKKSAVERKDELENGWRVFGCYKAPAYSGGAECEITEASVVDVKIVDPARPPEAGAQATKE